MEQTALPSSSSDTRWKHAGRSRRCWSDKDEEEEEAEEYTGSWTPVEKMFASTMREEPGKQETAVNDEASDCVRACVDVCVDTEDVVNRIVCDVVHVQPSTHVCPDSDETSKMAPNSIKSSDDPLSVKLKEKDCVSLQEISDLVNMMLDSVCESAIDTSIDKYKRVKTNNFIDKVVGLNSEKVFSEEISNSDETEDFDDLKPDQQQQQKKCSNFLEQQEQQNLDTAIREEQQQNCSREQCATELIDTAAKAEQENNVAIEKTDIVNCDISLSEQTTKCLNNMCDVVDCVSELINKTSFDKTNSVNDTALISSKTTKKRPVCRTKKKRRWFNRKSCTPENLSLNNVVPGSSNCVDTGLSNHVKSGSNNPEESQVLDLTTKPRKAESEKVKPIKRLSSRGLNHVFGQIASEYVLKVPSVRASSRTMRIAERYTPVQTQGKKKKPVIINNQPPVSDKYVFQIEDYHQSVTDKGQKIYTCDICSGVYQRSFSLKRHYLRVHINYAHLTERDISNCGIAGSNTVINKKPQQNNDTLTDLFRCHTCGVCFDFKHLLIEHLKNHPSSETSSVSKPYSCIHCPATFTHQHNYRKHQSFHAHLAPTTPNFSSASSAVAYPCSYCYKAFPSPAVRKKHAQQHKEAPSHACMFLCGETFTQLTQLREHLTFAHGAQYLGCPNCEERFLEQKTLDEHVSFQHDSKMLDDDNSEERSLEQESLQSEERLTEPTTSKEPPIDTNNEIKVPVIPDPKESEIATEPKKKVENADEFRYTCTVCNETFTNYVNMCKHRRLAHGTVGKHTKAAPKTSETPKPTPSSSQSSSRSQSPSSSKPPTDNSCSSPLVSANTTVSCNIHDNLLNYLDGKIYQETSGPEEGLITVSLTSELTITALAPEVEPVDETSEDMVVQTCHKLAWEKYCFKKTNNGGGCLEVFVMEDLSHLDLGTQFTMKQKAAAAASEKSSETNKQELSETSLFLRRHLSLIETVSTSQSKVDDLKLSGEWIRPRSYICCICAHKSIDLWDLEDHMFTSHYNVWWTFLALDASTPVPGDLFHRTLQVGGAIASADFPSSLSDSQCTKCGRSSHTLPELHRHMLECGGDFTWMYSSPTRRKSKWRPFGTRRRRQQGRRGMKRNIPNSPVKIHRGRLKGADSDSIQRMIANLPAKRATRRVIQFTDDEIKTRSQATINNVTFSSPFPRLSLKSTKLPSPSSKHQRRGRPKSVSPIKKVSELSEPTSEPKKPEEGRKRKIRTEEVDERGIRRHLFPLEPPFICNGCGTEFYNSSSCERHAKKCVYRHLFQEDVEVTKPSVACANCNKTYVSTAYLEKHTKICVVTASPKISTKPSVTAGTKVTPSSKASVVSNPKVNDLDMPTLQKEEPIKTSRVKKTINIPVLSPVNNQQKPKTVMKKKKMKRKVAETETNVEVPPPPPPPAAASSVVEEQVQTGIKRKRPFINKVHLKNKKLKRVVVKTEPEEVVTEVPQKTKKGRLKKVESLNSEVNSVENEVKPGNAKRKMKTKGKSKRTLKVPDTVEVVEPRSLVDYKPEIDAIIVKTRKLGFKGRRKKGLKVKLALSKVHTNGVLQEKYDNVAPGRKKRKTKASAVKTKPVIEEIVTKPVITEPCKKQKRKKQVEVEPPVANGIEKKTTSAKRKLANNVGGTKRKRRLLAPALKQNQINRVAKKTGRKKSKPVEVEEPVTPELTVENQPIEESSEILTNPSEPSTDSEKVTETEILDQSQQTSTEGSDKLAENSSSGSSQISEKSSDSTKEISENVPEISTPDSNKLAECSTEMSNNSIESFTEAADETTETPNKITKTVEENNSDFSGDSHWCQVCNKKYSSTFNLLKHRTSMKHKRNAESAVKQVTADEVQPEQPHKEQPEPEQPLEKHSESEQTDNIPSEPEQPPEQHSEPKQPLEEQSEVDHVIEQSDESDHLLQEQSESDHLVLDEPESDHLLEKQSELDHLLEEQPESDHLLEKQSESDHLVLEEPESDHHLEEQSEPNHHLEEQPEPDLLGENSAPKQPLKEQFEPEKCHTEDPQPLEHNVTHSEKEQVDEIQSEAAIPDIRQSETLHTNDVQLEPVQAEQPESMNQDLQQALQLEERLTEHQHLEEMNEGVDFARDLNEDKCCPPAPPPSPVDQPPISRKKFAASKRTKKGGRGRKRMKKIDNNCDFDIGNCYINILPSEELQVEQEFEEESSNLSAATLQHITNVVERELSSPSIATLLDVPVVPPPDDLSSRLFDELKRNDSKNDNVVSSVCLPSTSSSPLPSNVPSMPLSSSELPSTLVPTTATAAADFAGYPGQYPYDWSSEAAPALVEPSSGDNWNYNNWNGWTPQSQWPSTYYPPTTDPTLAESSQSGQNQSFGDILGSVHQVLEDGASEYASSEYSVNQSSDPYLLDPFGGRQSFEEIQKAIGATDEEMAMLQQLGQGSFSSHEFVYDNNASQSGLGEGDTMQPLDNPDLIDLDNQASVSVDIQDQQVHSPLLEDTSSVSRYSYDSDSSQATSSQLPPTTKLLSIYEKKEMVCPVCNRHFLGLQALETHISWIHKMKDAKKRIFNKKENSSGRVGYSSLLAREPGCLVGSAAGVVLGSAGGIRGGVLRAAAGAAAEAAEEAASKKRKLACFVCKELYSDVIALNRHIAQLHIKKKGDSDKDGGLKSQMSSALGGLLDRALSNMLGKAGRNPNQNIGVLNKLCLLPPMSGEKSAHQEEDESDSLSTVTTFTQQTDTLQIDNLKVMPQTDCLTTQTDSFKIMPQLDSLKVIPRTYSRMTPQIDSLKIPPQSDSLKITPQSDSLELTQPDESFQLTQQHETFINLEPQTESSVFRQQTLQTNTLKLTPSIESPKLIQQIESFSPQIDTLTHETDAPAILEESEENTVPEEIEDIPAEIPEIDVPSYEQQEESAESCRDVAVGLNLSADDVEIPDTQEPSETCAQELTTKATPEQIAQNDPLLAEPPSDELLCPICIAAMKHYHSLVRHMKTQHCDWDIQAFSTDMYNYLIIKKDYEVIRKKYSINVPALRGVANKSTFVDGEPEPDMAELLRDRRPSKSGSSTSESGSLASSRLDTDLDHDTIRARAFAALRQLNRRPSRSGRLQSVPIRGSKRRPLDIYEFFDEEDSETPSLRHPPNKTRKNMKMLEERGQTMDLNELFVVHEDTDSVQCKNCLKWFKSMQTFWRHAKGDCKKFLYGESSSDNDSDDNNKNQQMDAEDDIFS